MKIAEGPRPLTIHVFAAAFLAAAVIALIDGISDIAGNKELLQANVPDFSWNDDAVIVLMSARLSIAFIPVVLVWMFASSIARWLVTLMGLGKLVNVPDAVEMVGNGQPIDPLWVTSLVLALFAVALLFLPSSTRWFEKRPQIDPNVFK